MCGWRAFSYDIADWEITAAAVLCSVQISGPVAAGVAVWAGGQERRQKTSTQRVLAARDQSLPVVIHALATVIWAVVAQLVVIAALYGVTWWQDGHGRPSVLAPLVAASQIAAHVLTGYLVGRLAPWRFTPLFVALGCYLANGWAMDYAGRTWYLFLPVNVEPADVFDHVAHRSLVAILLWALALCATLLCCVAWFCAGRRPLRDHHRLIGASAATMIVGAVAVGQVTAAGGSTLADTRSTDTLVCTDRVPTVCVHPAFKDQLKQLARMFEDVDARMTAVGDRPGRFEQQPRGVDDRPSPGALSIHLDDATDLAIEGSMYEYIDTLHVSETCDTEEAVPLLPYTDAVDSWLSGTALALPPDSPEIAAVIQAFAQWPEQDRVAWLGRHWDEYRGCGLDAGSFR